ncbi:hypothetical protein KKE45_03940 [Patescibacteria group bacterium]|nr:hypothetical protein [Patescibacteria group bacterium]
MNETICLMTGGTCDRSSDKTNFGCAEEKWSRLTIEERKPLWFGAGGGTNMGDASWEKFSGSTRIALCAEAKRLETKTAKRSAGRTYPSLVG